MRARRRTPARGRSSRHSSLHCVALAGQLFRWFVQLATTRNRGRPRPEADSGTSRGHLCENSRGNTGSEALLAYRMQVLARDDGWNGSTEYPSITVQSSSLEQAKSDMEIALGKHIESLLRETRSASAA